MADGKPHRSRTAWPGPLSVAGVGEGHTHDLPPALLKRIRRQGRAVLIIGACVVALGVLFLLIIFQRGEQRDRETAEIREENRRNTCELLDHFPEGGWLDRPRETFRCGPGIPVEQLTPEERELIDRRSAPAPVPQVPPPVSSQPESNAPPPDVMGGASPDAPRVVPEPPPSREPSPPAPEPSPADVLSPVTEPLCDALGVCL